MSAAIDLNNRHEVRVALCDTKRRVSREIAAQRKIIREAQVKLEAAERQMRDIDASFDHLDR